MNFKKLSCFFKFPSKSLFISSSRFFSSEGIPKCSLHQLPSRAEYLITRENWGGASSNHDEMIDSPYSKTKFHWKNKPKTILFVRKNCTDTIKLVTMIANWFSENHKECRLLVEPVAIEELKNLQNENDVDTPADLKLPLYTYSPEDSNELARVVDFVICLGGDGSILHVSSLFGVNSIPPVLTFSVGTLSFLAAYQIKDFKEALINTMKGGFFLTNRMRISCELITKNIINIPNIFHKSIINNENSEPLFSYKIALINEVVLKRGNIGLPIKLDCAVNNQFLTSTTGDGLIVATATGSTAYSLSSGGSMVHPSIRAILLTPICPRSLSFRPLVLPCDVVVTMKVSEASRTNGYIFFDGTEGVSVSPGDIIKVSKSPYSIPTIAREDAVFDWVFDLNEQLKWNQNLIPFSQLNI